MYPVMPAALFAWVSKGPATQTPVMASGYVWACRGAESDSF